MINAVPATSYHTGTPKILYFHRDSERSRKLPEVTQLSLEFGRVGRDLPLWFASQCHNRIDSASVGLSVPRGMSSAISSSAPSQDLDGHSSGLCHRSGLHF